MSIYVPGTGGHPGTVLMTVMPTVPSQPLPCAETAIHVADLLRHHTARASEQEHD